MQSTYHLRPAQLWLATALTSLLYAAAHPPWSVWPLALIAVAPVSGVLLDRRARVGWRRAAVAGALFGALSTYGIVGHWSWLAAREFFVGTPAGAVGFSLALPLLASGIVLHYAIAFALIARLADYGATVGVIGSAALWAATEMTRGSIGVGNPWGSFAAALASADAMLSTFRSETPVAGLLSLGGPPLVAFLAAATGTAVGMAWCERHDRIARGRALAVGAAVFAALVLASSLALDFAPLRVAGTAPREPLRVALVQPGRGGSHPWQGSGAAEAFRQQIGISRGPEIRGADLVVWPENALAFMVDANPERRDALRDLARELGSALLVGGSRSAPRSGGVTEVFNSAFLFPADGGEPLVYDKRVLLPFVERVPGWAAPFLASPWQGAYTAGDGPGVFVVKGWRIAPMLCLEALYSSDAVRRVEAGADLIVNLSNDSWFDSGAGPEQHFALAALLAAETRRPLVRVTTTGISALVGENGLVSWRLPVRVGAAALLDVVPPARDSLFVRGGRSGVGLLLLALAAVCIALPTWIGRYDQATKRQPPGDSQ